MKYTYILLLSVLLVSCGAQIDQDITTQVTSDIDWEMSNLSEDNFETDSEVTKLDVAYKNPATEVDMVVSYTLDDNGLIKTISADATQTPNQIPAFNKWLQTLVGKPLEDGKNLQVAGASLASEAFRNAIK